MLFGNKPGDIRRNHRRAFRHPPLQRKLPGVQFPVERPHADAVARVQLALHAACQHGVKRTLHRRQTLFHV